MRIDGNLSCRLRNNHTFDAILQDYLARLRVAFRLWCLESLRGNQRVEMALKKIAAAHVLPETSPSAEIASQIAAAEIGAWRKRALRSRSQDQKAIANSQEKKR